MLAQQILETERLLLRPFKICDAKRVQILAGRKEVAETTNLPHPYKIEMAEGWIKTHEPTFREGRGVTFAITLKDTGELIGTISLMDITKTSNHARIGFWIGVPYWNKGYCTEAGKAVLEYGFVERGLNRIYTGYMISNLTSGRVLEKLGMKYEGTQRQHITKLGEYEDLVLVGLLKSEWKTTEKRE
jgi:ribosomal-protein-alanine N-acetyltransferase